MPFRFDRRKPTLDVIEDVRVDVIATTGRARQPGCTSPPPKRRSPCHYRGPRALGSSVSNAELVPDTTPKMFAM
jgi:hypothetical protein